MATADDFRRIALSFEGASEAPHFDRRAFKARRTFATLAADELTANIRFPHEEQAFRCEIRPDAFSRVPNKFGDDGWTTAQLGALSTEELKAVLSVAWRHQAMGPGTRRTKRRP